MQERCLRRRARGCEWLKTARYADTKERRREPPGARQSGGGRPRSELGHRACACEADQPPSTGRKLDASFSVSPGGVCLAIG